MVRSGVRRLSNWKAPGPDGVVGFWFKKLTSVHTAMAENLQLCLEKGKVPLWMAKSYYQKSREAAESNQEAQRINS